MATLHTLLTTLEAMAPSQLAASWDVSGMQVYCQKQNIKTVCVALDPTEAIINQAIAKKADFILTHHPLSLSPQFISASNSYFKIVSALIKNDIFLFAAHTSLDAQLSGPVGWLASFLELQDVKPIELIEKNCHQSLPDNQLYGMGAIGTLPKTLSFTEFVQKLTASPVIHSIRGGIHPPERINCVAYCTGSGSSLGEQAFALGADVFITGDMKYHQMLDSGGCVLDVGHHCLEEEMMRLVAINLQKVLPDMEIHFIPSQDPLRGLDF